MSARPSTRSCGVCGGEHYGRDLCKKHWQRWKRTGGTDLIVRGQRYEEYTPAARLAAESERRGQCLIFTGGAENRSGHVRIWRDGVAVGVHRIAYELANGSVPAGLIVRHTCDVPRCIEPSHLLVGTHADNAADRDRRGRGARPKGSRNGAARLTEGQVEQILIALADGRTQRSLAADYGVSQPAIALISRGRTWSHVARPGRNVA